MEKELSRLEQERLVQEQQDAVRQHFEESLRRHHVKNQLAHTPLFGNRQQQEQQSQAHQRAQGQGAALAPRSAMSGGQPHQTVISHHPHSISSRGAPSMATGKGLPGPGFMGHPSGQVAESGQHQAGKGHLSHPRGASFQDTQSNRALDAFARMNPNLHATQQYLASLEKSSLFPYQLDFHANPQAVMFVGPPSLDHAASQQFSLYGYQQPGRPAHSGSANQPQLKESSKNGAQAKTTSSAFSVKTPNSSPSSPAHRPSSGHSSPHLQRGFPATSQGARLPPPAHGSSIKRESPSPLVVDQLNNSPHHLLNHRSLTPDNRTTALWRPQSLSPKHQVGSHLAATSRASPQDSKPFDGRASAPPAHQNSSSPLTLPSRLSTPTLIATSNADQPENLVVNSESKSKSAKFESHVNGFVDVTKHPLIVTHPSRTTFVPQAQRQPAIYPVPLTSTSAESAAVHHNHHHNPQHVDRPSPLSQGRTNGRPSVPSPHASLRNGNVPLAVKSSGGSSMPASSNSHYVNNLISQTMSSHGSQGRHSPVQSHASASSFAGVLAHQESARPQQRFLVSSAPYVGAAPPLNSPVFTNAPFDHRARDGPPAAHSQKTVFQVEPHPHLPGSPHQSTGLSLSAVRAQFKGTAFSQAPSPLFMPSHSQSLQQRSSAPSHIQQPVFQPPTQLLPVGASHISAEQNRRLIGETHVKQEAGVRIAQSVLSDGTRSVESVIVPESHNNAVSRDNPVLSKHHKVKTVAPISTQPLPVGNHFAISSSASSVSLFVPVQFGQGVADAIPLKSTLKSENLIDNSSSSCSTPRLSQSPTNSSPLPNTSSAPNLKKKWLQRHTKDDNMQPDVDSGPPLLSDVSPKRIKLEANADEEPTIPPQNAISSQFVSEPAIKVGLVLPSVTSDLSLDGKNSEVKVESLPVEKANDSTESGSETDTGKESSTTPKKPKVAAKKRLSKGSTKEKKPKKTKVSNDDGVEVKVKDSEARKKTKKVKKTPEKEVVQPASDEESNVSSKTSKNSKSPKGQGKRGRKPKEEKTKDTKVPKVKDLKQGKKKAKRRCTTSALRESGEPFLQNDSCTASAPKLPKCRECRVKTKDVEDGSTVFCRFFEFRKLSMSGAHNDVISSPGFSEPNDASDEDRKLWDPKQQLTNSLTEEEAKYVLHNVGPKFFDLLEQESMAVDVHLGDSQTAWKKVVNGVREMCDVCETTLFNMHWVCKKCGFVVCIDCYGARMCESDVPESKTSRKELKDRDDGDAFGWLYCNGKQAHDQTKLMRTQIVVGDSLAELGRLFNDTLKRLKLPWMVQYKDLEQKENKVVPNGTSPNGAVVDAPLSMKEAKTNGLKNVTEQNSSCHSDPDSSPLSMLANVALNSEKSQSAESAVQPQTEGGKPKSQLRSLLETSGSSTKKEMKHKKMNGQKVEKPSNGSVEHREENRTVLISEKADIEKGKERSTKVPLPKYGPEESKRDFPAVNHDWYCGDKLLCLYSSEESNNLKLFQQQWKRNKPVLVSKVNESLDKNLWTPQCFAKEFAEMEHVVVDCHSGEEIDNHKLRKFWDGFENLKNRVKHEDGTDKILKLKDYPPGNDFESELPRHHADFMKALPIGAYTKPSGGLNLAARLPDTFVKPDLGPKMYVAYGPASPEKGTTNLHLDISDALNIMCYVGIPKKAKGEAAYEGKVRKIVEANCDERMKTRIDEKGVRVGALWHIYDADEAEKIRKFLNNIAKERNLQDNSSDRINDQTWYLDDELRKRLKLETGVEGYAIAQCLGDAIFIPAGAPHQVLNLNSCIKLAGDFISPENIEHCFNLTEQFRQLPGSHLNHQDKLQIKNTVFHAVKDALSKLNEKDASSVDSKSGIKATESDGTDTD